MGKSIRSKRMKKLRSIKREKLLPRENILLEQRAAIMSVIKGDTVDESLIPQLPEEANAIPRFAHAKDGKPVVAQSITARYGHLATHNVSITKFNTLEALSARYDKPVPVKKEGEAKRLTAAQRLAALPSTMTRRSRGRDRAEKAISASSTQVKKEGEDDEDDDMEEGASGAIDVDAEEEQDDDDQIRYGEFGKPAHVRAGVIRSKLGRKRSKSKGRGGFLNWHNLAASS